MTTTKSENLEKLENGVRKWVSLDGEYTDFTIVQSILTQDEEGGFFLVDHKESVEIIYAWISSFSSEIQLSVDFKTNGTSEQLKDAKNIFEVFASRLKR